MKNSKRKIHLVRQTSQSDCGLACLAMLLDVSLYELKARNSVSSRGMSFRDVIDASYMLDIPAKGFKLNTISDASLKSLPVPCMIHMKDDHFVVLGDVSESNLFIFDPARGELSVSFDEAKEILSGAYIQLDLEIKNKSIYDKLSPLTSQTKNFLVQHWDIWILSILLVIGISAASIILPSKLATLIINAKDEAQNNFVEFSTWAIFLVSATIFFKWSRSRIQMHLDRVSEQILTEDLIYKILYLPLRFFTNIPRGDLLSRINSTNMIRDFLTNKLALTATDSIALLVVLGGILFESRILFVAFISMTFLLILLLSFCWEGTYKVVSNEISTDISAQQVLTETITFATDLKTTKCEKSFFERWSSLFRKSLDASLTRARWQSYVDVIFELQEKFVPIVLLIIGLYLSQTNVVSQKVAVYVFFLASWAGTTIRSLMSFAMQLIAVKLNIDRMTAIAGLLSIEPEKQTLQSSIDFKGHNQAVEIREVNFSYRGTGVPTVKNISFSLGFVGFAVLVGPSGSGKSTILKIISGLLAQDSGTVKINSRTGENKIIYLPQHPVLFEGTVKENISGFGNTTDLAVINAAKIASIHDEIMLLPKKYDTLVYEQGSNLSSGQRQRIALARALLTQPEVLLLDEFSSDLDRATEENIIENLRKLDICILAATHRTYWIQSNDFIVTINNGEVQQASSDHLIPLQKNQNQSDTKYFKEKESTNA